MLVEIYFSQKYVSTPAIAVASPAVAVVGGLGAGLGLGGVGFY